MAVDGERLLHSWLAAGIAPVPAFSDTIPDGNQWPGPPVVRHTLVGGGPSLNATAVWLEHLWFQIDVYGGTKAEAQAIKDGIVQNSNTLLGVHSEGVVTGVEVRSVRSLPDPGYRPTRPRYVISLYLSVHP